MQQNLICQTMILRAFFFLPNSYRGILSFNILLKKDFKDISVFETFH